MLVVYLAPSRVLRDGNIAFAFRLVNKLHCLFQRVHLQRSLQHRDWPKKLGKQQERRTNL